MNTLYGLVVVVVLILVWIMHLNYQSNVLHTLLSGFWEADSNFCNESGLDTFCFYLDEDYNTVGQRACYVLAMRDNAIVLNEPTVARISLQYMRANNWKTSLSSPKYLNIEFKNIQEENESVFPKKQEMRFYPICNKIVLFYDDVITAVLYKNPVNTELKALVESKD